MVATKLLFELFFELTEKFFNETDTELYLNVNFRKVNLIVKNLYQFDTIRKNKKIACLSDFNAKIICQILN